MTLLAGTGAISITPGSSTINFTGNSAGHQQFVTNGQPFNNFTINNNQATYDYLNPNGDLDINGNLTITDGQLRLDAHNSNINTAAMSASRRPALLQKAQEPGLLMVRRLTPILRQPR